MADTSLTCERCGTQNPAHARFCLSCGGPLAARDVPSRRAVTTLFCDLVGSTELGRVADAETAHHVLGRFYETTRRCVIEHGGTLEKFVGDAVMAVFGYPRLREDDALRAARAALAIRLALDELNQELERDWGLPLRIRTGVATGEVMAGVAGPEEPFVIGSSVNLAARLEQAAEPGQILLDEETASRIRRRAEVRRLPRATLKGFSGAAEDAEADGSEGEGVPIFELLGVRDDRTSRPTPLVGRASDLRLLEEALRGALDQRRCRVVNVVGDAGVGKTRLLDAFVARVGTLAVVRGRCAPAGDAPPLRPLAEIVAAASGTSPDDDLGSASTAERAAAVRSLLTDVARDADGLVVLVDDIHHASSEVLEILEHLAGWTRDAPILVLCAGRPEVLLVHPSWGRIRGGITVHLEPLGTDDAVVLARSLLGERSDDAVERRIAEVSGGNPFFIEEVVAALPPSQDAIGEVAVPPTVMSLLDARVDALDGDERFVLERAAVLGTRFRLDELAALCGSEPGEALSGLADRDLIVRDADGGDLGWRFRHSLIRDAAYQAVPKGLRADLHVSVAERVGDDARAGFHLERAATTLRELGSRSPAVGELAARAGARLAAAGRDASRRGDVASAVSLLERSVALLPADDGGRPDALTDLAYACLYAGDIDAADHAVEELLSAAGDGDDLLGVRARMQRAHISFIRDASAAPVAAYRETLEAVIPRFEQAGEERDLAAALTDLAVVRWVEGDGAAMIGAAERAMTAAERCGDPRAVQEAAPLLATGLLLGPTPLPDVLARLSALDDELGADRLARATVLLSTAQALALVGRDDEAATAAADARETFEDLGQRRWLAACDATDALLALERDDVAGAVAKRRAAHAFFVEQGDALNAHVAAATLADALVLAGDLQAADELITELPAASEAAPDPEVEVTSAAVRAAVAAGRGDAARAGALASEALRIADATDFVMLQADTRATLAAAKIDPERLTREAVQRYEAKGATSAAARLRPDG